MKQELLNILCDPEDKSELRLVNPVFDEKGDIVQGLLVSASGRNYPIRNGVPRFTEQTAESETVESFGDQWNYFNFDDFKLNWLGQTIKNTFGSPEVFRGKVVVDAGAGSGMQSKWIAEAGAKQVIALELSHSVDDVMKRNLQGLDNIDVIQCSIDRIPLRDASIDGIVMCHNVIQHTPSVEKTARELWRVVGASGEFVFNCYPKNDLGFVRKARLAINLALRGFLSRRSFRFRLAYARLMAVLRFVPILGQFLEKSMFVVRGEVLPGAGYLRRAYRGAVLNTFDWFGAHEYQHLKSDREIQALVVELKPARVLNMDRYFLRPQPIGIALRLIK